MAIFFTIFFTIYAALNYYIFSKGWSSLAALPHLRIAYLIVFLALSLSYIAAKFMTKILPHTLYDIMLWIGSFWFALMLYFFLAAVLIDLLRLLNFWFGIFPSFINNNFEQVKLFTAGIVVLLTLVTVAAGYINTTIIKVKDLNLTMRKGKSNLKELKIAMASDIHLSPMDNEKFLTGIVDKLNSLNPDIILIPGDLFDDEAFILKQRNIGPALLKLKAKYGVYACTGNHEFINHIDSAVAFMESYNIKVIRDSSLLIENAFNLVSRDDRAKKQFTGKDRKPLEDIMESVDKSYPIILLDHTPFALNEAQNNGVDLQLSGHTHHGQIFPANLITKMIYEMSWGYLKKGNTQYYVSCGAGTWGPRVRLGSRSEVVNINLRFVD